MVHAGPSGSRPDRPTRVKERKRPSPDPRREPVGRCDWTRPAGIDVEGVLDRLRSQASFAPRSTPQRNAPPRGPVGHPRTRTERRTPREVTWPRETRPSAPAGAARWQGVLGRAAWQGAADWGDRRGRNRRPSNAARGTTLRPAAAPVQRPESAGQSLRGLSSPLDQATGATTEPRVSRGPPAVGGGEQRAARGTPGPAGSLPRPSTPPASLRVSPTRGTRSPRARPHTNGPWQTRLHQGRPAWVEDGKEQPRRQATLDAAARWREGDGSRPRRGKLTIGLICQLPRIGGSGHQLK